MQNRRWRLSASVAMVMATLVSACSVSSPLEISSTGAGLERGASLKLSRSEDAQSLKGRFEAALAEALTQGAVPLSDQAQFVADISVAQAGASGGVVRGEGEADKSDADQDWISTPRERRTFDRCKAQRLRATLVIYDKVAGTVIYRGSGQATQCEFDQSDLTEFANALVQDATASATP